MKYLFTLLLFLISSSVILFAQLKPLGKITGKVVDTTANQILPDATISLLKNSDSSLIKHSLSGKDGSFVINDISYGEYILQVSYQGYNSFYRNIIFSQDNILVNAGTIRLSYLPQNLGEVIVQSTAAISVKGDTTEFSASRFKTKPNSNAEDLLKKIPGVEVDKDGSVKAQGEQVAKVMVDGKMFFGNDAKMATQNLPTDIIDKIQIIDAQSEQSVFTGFDDGTQEKIINIITKKDKRKGSFGKGSISMGNDGRYGVNLNLNRFNGNRKISFIGQANNTNQENYSISEILQLINAGGLGIANAGFGNMNMAQSGIARTYNGGLNYTDVYGTQTQVSGNYRYQNTNILNQSARLRETFVSGDSSLFNNNTRYANNRNINQSINFEINHKFDTSNSILIRPSYTSQRSNNYSETNSLLTRGKSLSQRDVRTINNSLTNQAEFNNSILFRHRFAKKGRTFSLNYRFSTSKAHTDRTADNYTNNYNAAGIKYDTVKRISNIDRQAQSNGVRVSYTEPLSAKSNLEINYELDKDINVSDQRTNSFNSVSNAYDLVDTVLSNSFKNSNLTQRGGANFRHQINKEWNYSLGLSVENREMTSDNQTRKLFLAQSFFNLIPTATLSYRKNKSTNFRLNYRGVTRQPGINQLQDVVDNTNLLHITRGNPGLKQEFSNNLNFRFTKVNQGKGTNFIVRLNGAMVSNKITNAITINNSQSNILVDNVVLEPFAQYSKPVNIDGVYNLKTYINYGFPLRAIKSNVNLSTDLSLSRDVNLVNGIKGFTRSYVVGERIRLTTNINERFDLNFTSSSTYNIARYSLRPEQNGNFFTQVLSVEPTYNTKSGWMMSIDFDYTKTTGQAAGYNQSIPLLNTSVSKFLFKQKQGEIKLSVLDVFNQNNSITRTVEENYIEDVRTNVLKRYFLLSFIYNFRKFGS